MLIKRHVVSNAARAAGVPAAEDVDASKRIPAVVEWLASTVWEDGAKRRTGTAMILAEDGVWKVWLHDRDASRSCWLSAGTLWDLLLRMDEVLGSGSGEWRADKAPGKK